MKLTIRAQILAACLMVVAAFSAVNIFVYFKVQDVVNNYTSIITHDVPFVHAAKEITAGLYRQNAEVRAYILTGDKAYSDGYQNAMANNYIKVTTLKNDALTPDEQEKVAAMEKILDKFRQTMDPILFTRRYGDEKAAAAAMVTGKQAVETAEKELEELTKYWEDRVAKDIAASDQKRATADRVMLIADATISIVAIVLTIILSVRIVRPLREVVGAANAIADGDLREKTFTHKGNDEAGELIKAFMAMRANLRQLVGRVSESAGQVAAASEELTASAQQSAQAAGQVAQTIAGIATGATSQVAAVERAAATTSGMVSSVSKIAEGAGRLAQHSRETAEAAKTGGDAVEVATGQMETIRSTVSRSTAEVAKLGESSAKIVEIVDVITAIAGQTNLLALNAAIEAARAGEAGRGFAVVAEEVRKLAEQSETAAGKIAALVADIRAETETVVRAMRQGEAEVAKGTDVVTAAGERFRHIVGLVQELDGQISQITAAATGLTDAGKEVVASVEKVRNIAAETAGGTQTISAASEEQTAILSEVSRASQELASLAEGLQEAVSRFRL